MPLNHSTVRIIDDNIKTDLGLKEGYDSLPKQVVPQIQPVYEVYRRVANLVRSFQSTATGSITVFTTPADRDFFLQSASISVIKDATCDSATGRLPINITVAGVTREILAISTITLTAESHEIAISFPAPIKVDRNTAITCTIGSFTVGACVRAGCITGYTNLPSQPERTIEVS